MMVKKFTKMGYKPKIKTFLEGEAFPVDVEKIRAAVGIGNWNTALKHCLELLISGEVQGQKTSKSWVFWIDKEEVKNDWRNQ